MLSLYYSPKVTFTTQTIQLKASMSSVVSKGCVVASEPLGGSRHVWNEVPPQHIIHILNDCTTNVYSLNYLLSPDQRNKVTNDIHNVEK